MEDKNLEKEIISAWVWIREHNHSIPDNVLDLMKDAAIQHESLMQALDVMLDTFVYSKDVTAREKTISLGFAMKVWAQNNNHSFPSIGQHMSAKKLIEKEELLNNLNK